MTSHSCKLCDEFNSKENIIKEFKHVFLMFNRYPYVPGHIMLVPKRAFSTLYQYSDEERTEIFDILYKSQHLLMQCLEVTSSNIGLNTGPNSGGSIPSHLHIHILPRCDNDMNFMMTTTENPIRFREHNDSARKKILESFKTAFV